MGQSIYEVPVKDTNKKQNPLRDSNLSSYNELVRVRALDLLPNKKRPRTTASSDRTEGVQTKGVQARHVIATDDHGRGTKSHGVHGTKTAPSAAERPVWLDELLGQLNI
ncbi:hypothetical protein ACOSQ2_022653 [Xanthoceras sorbifolium]